MNWFSGLSEALQVAVLSSTISVGITLLTIFSKDLLLPIFKERRTKKMRKVDALKRYANPVMKAAESLVWRLIEIFHDRSAYLLEDCPKTEFSVYKFESTVYRLCALIGWIQGAKKELSYLETGDQRRYEAIDRAISAFESALADGKDTRVTMLEGFCECIGTDISHIDRSHLQRIAAEIMEETSEHLTTHNRAFAYELPEHCQKVLFANICRIVSENVGKPVSLNGIEDVQAEAIMEISRVTALIYRDWQSAIGDLMLRPVSNGLRRYEVIGYKDFDAIYRSNGPEKQWLKKIERLFYDLNVTRPDKYDERLHQLKKVMSACIDLIEAFVRLDRMQQNISQRTLSIFREKGRLLEQTPSP